MSVAESQRVFIVVSGPPGSGKTTLAGQISVAMGLPLFSKDAMKEKLMNATTVIDVERSRELGRTAIALMYSEAAKSVSGAVLESTFDRSRARVDLANLRGAIIEVFCECSREISIARYRARANTRHPSHFDTERTDDDLWNSENAQPIDGPWSVIVTPTESPVEIEMLLKTIGQLLRARA